MIIKNIDTGLLYEIQPTKEHGENAMTCPACSPTRKKKRDRCFSWNVNEKVGRCNHCQAKFVEYRTLKELPAKTYTVPQWKNKTSLTDKAARWFEGRMISQQTIREMKIYSENVWMPQFGKEVEAMCFPYFVDGKLVNIKTRGPQKSFKMESGAELVFYNFDCIQDAKDLIICEGEIDALSFIDAGFKNVVSVPNGASATDMPFLENHIDRMSHIRKFYIAADFDEPGLKLRDELVRRLGFEKCAIVTYEGRKDANELYCAEGGLALHRIIENAQDVPVKDMINPESRYDNLVMMFRKGLPEGNRIGIDEIDHSIRWQASRLAIWTGIPSHGKSEMVDFVSLKLCLSYGWRTLFFSPENFPLEFHIAKLVSKLTGKEFKEGKMSESEFDQAYEFISSNFFWMDPYSQASIESILDRAKQYVKKSGIKQLVIDPFNCLEHNANRGENESTYIGRFLDTLARFSKEHDILIHLVAHPTKLEKDKKKLTYPAPTLYDISGSANFYNKADYGITVHRDFENARTYLIVTKVKFKNLGQPNPDGVELQYDIENGRYQVPPGDVYLLDKSNWLTGQTEVKPIPTSFNNDDCPF